LGTIQDQVGTKADHRLFKVRTVSTDDELRDLFVFHVSKGRCRSAMPPSPQSAAEPVVEPEAHG
jgi:two-component system chemotaxis sensor kinase CheA